MNAMNPGRIVDTNHDERNRALRAALECFAPLALTIRARPGGFEPRGKPAIR